MLAEHFPFFLPFTPSVFKSMPLRLGPVGPCLLDFLFKLDERRRSQDEGAEGRDRRVMLWDLRYD